jgi:hypothetical protein
MIPSVLGSFGDHVVPADDESDAAWVESRFAWELFNCSGYERYVQIDHRAPGGEEQWSTPPGVLSVIARTAADHTSTASEVCFGVWDGHGWDVASVRWISMDRGPHGLVHRWGSALRVRRVRHQERRRRTRALREFERELAAVPRLVLPYRSYYLLAGPLDAAPLITAPGAKPRPQAPDLWWPKDRAWFVATDTDLDRTVVGGSERFTEELLDALPGRSRRIAHP